MIEFLMMMLLLQMLLRSLLQVQLMTGRRAQLDLLSLQEAEDDSGVCNFLMQQYKNTPSFNFI